MAQPVWVLSVDLQTKTATFTSGLADAAKGARSSFQEIKAGADEMGRETGHSMMEARHGVMLLGEEFGIHLPRALTSFIASIGPIGAAMEAAFPFLAILVGATLLLEHLTKLKEEGVKLTESQAAFGVTVSKVLSQLKDKLLEAGIRSDELNQNHLAALHKQLLRIDHQSLNELVQSFDALEKAADKIFLELKTHWFSLSAGSTGAAHALKEFKAQYDELLSKGKETEASNLLKGTLDQARAFLNTMEAAKGTLAGDDKELKAQRDLVEILEDQVTAQKTLQAIKTTDKSNAVKKEQDKTEGDADKLAKEQFKERQKDAEAAQKLWDENYKRAVEALQENEREKMDATKQGSAARLAAINAAIKEEQSKGLQEHGFYRGLLTARVTTLREMLEEQKKLTAEAGKEEAEHGLKMGQLRAAADKNAEALRLSAKHASDRERVASAIKIENEEYEAHRTALKREIAALDQSGKEYENKLKALQNKQLELVREHENKVTQIKEKAEEDRNKRILAADERQADALAKSGTDMLMRRERVGKALINLGDQMAEGMIKNALKAIIADDMTKPHDAADAARAAFKTAMRTFPPPSNFIMAPLMGAAAFTAVMAFAGGGLVPGVGVGDTQPAILTPGESVNSKALTEGLTRMVSSGRTGGDTHIHMQAHFAPNVQALDREGVDRVLKEHAATFHRHFQAHVRKMNR